MIPESYTIGNFKAIGELQTIPLRPVTLIFGQNSAGKSSIIQSLLLSRFAMEKGTFDFSSTKRWGQSIDLGGFRQYIHRHELDRDLTIGFGFCRTKTERGNTPLESQVERRASAQAEDQSAPEWSFSFFNFIESLSVEASVGLPDPMVSERLGHRHPVVKKLVIQADGEALVSFTVDRQGNLQLSELVKNSHTMTVAMTYLLNSYRSALTAGEGADREDFDLGEVVKSLGTAPVDEKSFREVVSQVEQSYADAIELQSQEFDDLLGATEEMARFIWILGAQLLDELKTPGRALSLQGRGLNYEIRSKNRLAPTRLEVVATPEGQEALDTGTALGSAVESEAIEDPVVFFRDAPEESDDADALAKALRFDLEMVIDAALESLRWWLLGTEYIGPYRSIPDRYFQIAKPDTSPEVDQGYQTLRRIAENPKLLNRISNAFQDIMGSPYRLQVRKIAPSVDFAQLEEKVQRYLEVEAAKQGTDIKGGIAEVMAAATEGRAMKGVYLVDTRSGTDVDFCDVGFGIGQVLPLIAEIASDRSGLVCIEQPEAHLHPKMQSDLADVFVHDLSGEAASSEGTVARGLFLLETHSEHLILRMLRRIRETTAGELPDGAPGLAPDSVSVVWVEQRDGQAFATAIPITEEGDFSEQWPSGFFEERFEEYE